MTINRVTSDARISKPTSSQACLLMVQSFLEIGREEGEPKGMKKEDVRRYEVDKRELTHEWIFIRSLKSRGTHLEVSH